MGVNVKRIVAASMFLALALLVPATAFGVSAIDQDFSSVGGIDGQVTASDTTRLQTFIAGRTGMIDGVALYLRPDAAPAGFLAVTIFETVGGFPENPAQAVTTGVAET